MGNFYYEARHEGVEQRNASGGTFTAHQLAGAPIDKVGPVTVVSQHYKALAYTDINIANGVLDVSVLCNFQNMFSQRQKTLSL